MEVYEYMERSEDAAASFIEASLHSGEVITFEDAWGLSLEDYLAATGLLEANVSGATSPLSGDDGRYFAMCGSAAATSFNPIVCPGDGRHFSIYDRDQQGALVWHIYRFDANVPLGEVIERTWFEVNAWCSNNSILCAAVWAVGGRYAGPAIRWWRSIF